MPPWHGRLCTLPPISYTDNNSYDTPRQGRFLCLTLLFKIWTWSWCLEPKIAVPSGVGHHCKFLITPIIPYFPPCAYLYCRPCSSFLPTSHLSMRSPPILPEYWIIISNHNYMSSDKTTTKMRIQKKNRRNISHNMIHRLSLWLI